MKKIVKSAAYAFIVLLLANLGSNAFGTFAQQLHHAGAKNTPTNANSILQAEKNAVLKEKQLTLLKDAVGFALSASPKNNSPEELKKSLDHLYELNVLALGEYNKLPATAHTEKQKQERSAAVYNLVLLPITIELVKKQANGQLNLRILKNYLEKGKKNLPKIAAELRKLEIAK